MIFICLVVLLQVRNEEPAREVKEERSVRGSWTVIPSANFLQLASTTGVKPAYNDVWRYSRLYKKVSLFSTRLSFSSVLPSCFQLEI